MTTPSYADARRAINQHLHRHHHGETGGGTLSERLSRHDDLHFLFDGRGVALTHSHAPFDEEETSEALALRYLAEGNRG